MDDAPFLAQIAIVGVLLLGTSLLLLGWPARNGRRIVRFALVFVVTAVLLAIGWSGLARTRRASTAQVIAAVPDSPLPGDEFVTSATCKACHPNQYDSWHDSYHRTMTQRASREAVLGDFEDVRLTSRNRTYHLTRRGDELWVNMVSPEWERTQLDRGVDPGGARNPPRSDKRIVMTTGSHCMQTYWVGSDRDGRLFNFPFVWLNADQRWAPREDVFLRPPHFNRQFGTWHDNCVECHSVAGEQNFDAANGTFDPKAAELGIACEACHGPAEEHVRVNRDVARRYRYHFGDEPDTTIVNPARLSARASTHVCAQCHSMNLFKSDPRFATGERYRAGGDLTRSKMVLRTSDRNAAPSERADWSRIERHVARETPTYLAERFWPDGMARVSGRENNAMVESACFQGGTLSCLSCHSMHTSDPNDQLAAQMESDAACLQCHEELAARIEEHTHHARGSSGSACYNCHMPHTTYGLLKAIRSHLIDSPGVAASVTTGRPNACNLCHLDKTLAWTAEHLTRWYEQDPVELSEEQRTISADVLWLLTGDAGQRALVAWHLGWRPAQEASGLGWIPIYLAQLLDDPYACVRYIAHRSLRTIPGYEKVEYDFVGDAEARTAVRTRVEAMFAQAGADQRDRIGREVLLCADGSIDTTMMAMLAQRRDDRIVDLRE